MILDALLGGLVGSILTAIATIGYAEMQRKRDRGGTRAQIVFLLRQLQIHMGMIRDYPRYYFYDMAPLVNKLVELSLAPQSGSGLFDPERDAIFVAVYQTDHEVAYLNADRQKALDHGDDEYIQASARRAFVRLQQARQALHDAGKLIRPIDPHELHCWRDGDVIPGSEVA